MFLDDFFLEIGRFEVFFEQQIVDLENKLKLEEEARERERDSR